MTVPAEIPSPPLVWFELLARDIAGATEFYGSLLGWKGTRESGAHDVVVYLDKARIAGPVCGMRQRTPADPRPAGTDGPPPDRWTVRLAPPRPPAAIDPGTDQLLRPRAPGPRLGRWGVPNSLAYAELRTPDVPGARRWLERRLDAVVEPAGDALLLRSAITPALAIAAVVDEADPALAGWYPCAQVASLAMSRHAAEEAGATGWEDRTIPAGAPGTGAALVTDPGGAQLVLIEHGPRHGRR